LTTFAGTVSDVVEAWPISFCIGVIVGIVLAQRGYRIVRTRNEEEDPDGE
jgi:hypothetical protein